MSAAIRVTLPDGSVREVAGRHHAAPDRRGHRAGSGAGGPGRSGGRASPGPRPAARVATPRLAILTDRDPEALEVLRHSSAHILATAVRELFPGAGIGFGPADRGRLLLRLPGGPAVHPGGPGADRAQDGRGGRARLPVRARGGGPGRGQPPVRRRSAQARADRRAGRRRDHHGLHRRPVRRISAAGRTSRAPAGSSTSSCCMPPAPTGGATSGARCCSGSTAPPGSRRRISTPTSTGWRRRGSATTASSGKQLDLFSIQDIVGPGLVLLASQGGHDQVAADPRGRGRQRRPGLRPRVHAEHDPGGAVPDLRAPAALRGQPVSAHGRRRGRGGGRALPGEADELPDARPDLQEPAAELPRSSDPADRGGQRLPERAVGYPARPAARARASPWTTPTSSARWIRSRTRSSSAWTRWTDWCGRRSASSSTSRSRPARRSGWATTRSGIGPRPMLQRALERKGIPFRIDAGGGAFYGPKIDIKFRDAIGRLWQGPTIQLDFNLPGAVRAGVHRCRQQAAPAGDDPPRDLRHARAFHREPDRALRRRVPGLACAGAGAGDSDLGRPGGRRALARGAAQGRGAPGPRGRPKRDAELPDSRRRDAEGAVHGRGRPARGRERTAWRCGCEGRGRSRRCWRWATSWRG